MKPADYEFLSSFLMQKSGLALGSNKEYLLEARLIPVAQVWGLGDFERLVDELRRGKDQPLLTAVTEAMTTNETSFFRDKTPFDDLQATIIPALMRARGSTCRLRIWCAAASTGQEVFSLLMLLDESFPGLRNWTLDVIATDIAETMLNRCRDGLYSQFEVQRGLPIQLLLKYFNQVENGWQIKDAIRQRVKWQKLNLLDEFKNLGTFDLVLCRNVLIYFDHPTKKNILDRIHCAIRTDGYLILGAAETVLGINERFARFRACKSAVYMQA